MYFKKNKISILIFIIFFLSFFVAAGVIAADITDAFKPEYLDNTAGPDGVGYRTDTDPADLIGKVIQAILSFVGIIFLVLMIYGGYTWMLARGNEQEVAKAKNLITAAVIGIIVILSAYAISYFIFENIGKTTMSL